MNIWGCFLCFILSLKAILSLETYRQKKEKNNLDLSLTFCTKITQKRPSSLWYFCYSSPKGLRQQHKQRLKTTSGNTCHFNDLTPSWSQNNITKCNRRAHQTDPCLEQMISEQTLLISRALLVLVGSVPDFQRQVSQWVVHLLSSFFCFVSQYSALLGCCPSKGTPTSDLSSLASGLIFTKDGELTKAESSWLSLVRTHNWTSF